MLPESDVLYIVKVVGPFEYIQCSDDIRIVLGNELSIGGNTNIDVVLRYNRWFLEKRLSKRCFYDESNEKKCQ